jgi:16S rRNA G966 N2-methylase RsmD
MKALYYGDNLQVLRDSIATESVDLIYLDPPFNSNATYTYNVRCWRQSRHLAEWALTSAYSQELPSKRPRMQYGLGPNSCARAGPVWRP